MKTLLIALGTALLVGVVSFFLFHNASPKFGGSYGETANVFFKSSTSTQETVSSSASTRILATSTSRSWAVISNNSAFPIFCTENGDKPAANNAGTLVAASSTLTLAGNNLYMGSVQCIAQGSNATVWVEASQ